MKRIKIEFTDCWEGNPLLPESDRWIAVCEDFKIVVVGKTKQEAFDEVMISLRVKLLYDNNLTEIN